MKESDYDCSSGPGSELIIYKRGGKRKKRRAEKRGNISSVKHGEQLIC